MNPRLIRIVVRSLLVLTSRRRAIDQTERCLGAYLRLADRVTPEAGRRPVTVPPMPGVDEEMRRWSFFMVLAHNTIVNRGISATIDQLLRGEALHGPAVIDIKRDVLPDPSAGIEQVAAFRESVGAHLALVGALGRLRGTRTSPHALFGDFDAHMWNAMFAFHLKLHYRQARHVVRTVTD